MRIAGCGIRRDTEPESNFHVCARTPDLIPMKRLPFHPDPGPSGFVEELRRDKSGFVEELCRDKSGFVEKLRRDKSGFVEELRRDKSGFVEELRRDKSGFVENYAGTRRRTRRERGWCQRNRYLHL